MKLCLMPTQTDRMSDLELPDPNKADSNLGITLDSETG